MNPARRQTMQTAITERLGIESPLLAFSHSADIVVASRGRVGCASSVPPS
jgi:hypothetical protein